MKITILAALVLASISVAAMAQTAPPKPPTLSEQALSNKLTHEINEGLACDAAKIDVQRQLNDAVDQIKDLKAKLAALPPP